MTAADGPTELVSPARPRSGRFERGAWLSVGNGTDAACQWLVLVVLAKVTDSTTVGQYALALAVTAPIFMFSGLALRTVALTHDRTGLQLGHFVAVRLAASTLSVAAVALVSLLFDRKAALILFLVALAKCLDSIGDICLTPFQQHGRFGVMATSIGLNGLLTFAGMTAVLLVTPTLELALLASVVASAIASVVLPLTWLRTMRHQLGAPVVTPSPLTAQAWKSSTLVGVSTLALPLGLASGIASLTNNVPRYVLQVDSSTAALGIFTIITYVVNVSGIVSGSVAQALLPSMTSLARAGDRAGLRLV